MLEEMSVSLQARFSNVGGYGTDDRASSIRGVMINLHSDDEKLDLHMNTGSTGVFENLPTFAMVGQANRGMKINVLECSKLDPEKIIVTSLPCSFPLPSPIHLFAANI